MNDEQAILNIISSASALLVIIEIYQRLWIPDQEVCSVAHLFWNHRALDIELIFAIDADIPPFVISVGILLYILVLVEQILIALRTLP